MCENFTNIAGKNRPMTSVWLLSNFARWRPNFYMWVWWFDWPWPTSGPHVKAVQWILTLGHQLSLMGHESQWWKRASFLVVLTHSGAKEAAHWGCGPLLCERPQWAKQFHQYATKSLKLGENRIRMTKFTDDVGWQSSMKV